MWLMEIQAVVNTEVVSKLTKISSSVAACRIVMTFPVQPTFYGVLHSMKSWGVEVSEY